MLTDHTKGTPLRDHEAFLQSRHGPRAYAPGSEVSLGDLSQHVDVERLIGDDLFQPGVHPPKLVKTLGVVNLDPAVLGPPPMPRRVRDLQMTDHLVEVLLRDRAASRPNPGATDSHSWWTTFRGSGQSEEFIDPPSKSSLEYMKSMKVSVVYNDFQYSKNRNLEPFATTVFMNDRGLVAILDRPVVEPN